MLFKAYIKELLFSKNLHGKRIEGVDLPGRELFPMV